MTRVVLCHFYCGHCNTVNWLHARTGEKRVQAYCVKCDRETDHYK